MRTIWVFSDHLNEKILQLDLEAKSEQTEILEGKMTTMIADQLFMKVLFTIWSEIVMIAVAAVVATIIAQEREGADLLTKDMNLDPNNPSTTSSKRKKSEKII